MKSILHRSEESRLFAESVMYVSRVFFTSVIKRVFVSLPLAIYIKFLTDSHFTQTFFLRAFFGGGSIIIIGSRGVSTFSIE